MPAQGKPGTRQTHQGTGLAKGEADGHRPTEVRWLLRKMGLGRRQSLAEKKREVSQEQGHLVVVGGGDGEVHPRGMCVPSMAQTHQEGCTSGPGLLQPHPSSTEDQCKGNIPGEYELTGKIKTCE